MPYANAAHPDGKTMSANRYPTVNRILRFPFAVLQLYSATVDRFGGPAAIMQKEPAMEPTTAIAIAFGAILFGIDKSLASGAGLLAVATLTAVMPARDATGLTLLMAICADWSAIWAYRGNVSVRSLLRLIPFVVVGIACGIAFLYVADNTVMRKAIGIILGIFVASYFISLARKRLSKGTADGSDASPAPTDTPDALAADPRLRALSWAKRIVCGILAGFTTMVANAAGPVTTVFFMSENLPVLRFLGTTAWFYLIVNLIKLPISIHLGMISWQSFLSMAWTIPLIILTVIAGRAVAKRVSQKTFTVIVYALAVVAVARLLL